jgi:glutaredoxin-related protein
MIILYSNDCPKCRILKFKLDNKNIQYDLCSDIDIMISKGFQTMPKLEVDNKTMDFNEAVKWVLSK